MFSLSLLALLPLLAPVLGAPSDKGLRRRTDQSTSYQSASDQSSDWQSSDWESSHQFGDYQSEGWDGYSGGGSTVLYETTITNSASSSYETPQYGSGSWGSVSDYNSCAQMCQAQFGGGGSAPPAQSTGGSSPPPTTTSSSGAATTHTIIVAPSLGVLRFVPFAVNANEGDTLHYIWGAGPHTVTLSDGKNVCNRSTTSLAFDSGKLNATQTFETTVKFNASSPTFYYCTVGMHCAAGMFGLINPPTTNVTNNLTDLATTTSSAPVSQGTSGGGVVIGCQGNSMDCWIEKWGNSSPQARAMHDGVKSKCQSAPSAWSWGGKWDMSSYTTTVITKEIIIQNVMYSRLMLASNPSMLNVGSPIPMNYTTPPELSSFVASNSSTGGTASISTQSAIPSASEVAAGAANSTSTGGATAGLTASMTAMMGMAGLVCAMLL